MDPAKIEHQSGRSLNETPIKSALNDDVIPIDASPFSSRSSNSFIKSEPVSNFGTSPQAHFSLTDSNIYDGSIPDEDDIDFKLLYDTKKHEDQNDVEIDIPFAIECHLCNEMMNLCLRRTRYRGQSREYPAYRCNRKGCQTFRSIRKVFSNCVNEKAQETPQTMIYQPPPEKATPKFQSNLRADFSEDDIDDFVIQRVNMPKAEKRSGDPMLNRSLSVTDRVRRANQERAVVFSEFADQLRRDIAANKRIRVRKQLNEEDEQQGTLFYISKELNPQEIIELQDAIIKTLISLRKIPPPMTMLDLPLFANCPYSKSNLEAGLQSAKYRDDFWAAFTSSPQPPLPPGFIRRKDDTLIYKDPKPVPEILQQNSPRKQAEDIVNYNQRKGEQDAKRMEKRFTEKKYRTWASLKREFDLAEREGTEAAPPKMTRATSTEARSDRKRKVTLQELIDKMEGGSNGRMTGKIKPGTAERGGETMQWIDVDGDSNTQESQQMNKKSVAHEESYEQDDKKSKLSSVHQMMRTLSTPQKNPISPMMRSFSTLENVDMKQSLTPPIFFGDVQFNNNQFYSLNPYFSSYNQQLDSWTQNHRDLSNDQQYEIGGPPGEETSNAPYTFVHPDSGARLTDPSAYLNSFVPSPITKLAPMSFPEESGRPRRNSEPSTSSMYYEENNNRVDEKISEDNKKIIDNFLKFDPPLIGE